VIVMCKRIPNLEGYNGTDGIEDNTADDLEGYDAFFDTADSHFIDEEEYDRELDVPVWQRV